MRLEVRVIPRAKRRCVEQDEQGGWVVRVDAPPDDGRANKAVIETLADHFGVAARCVSIFRGERSRRKIVDITLPEGTTGPRGTAPSPRAPGPPPRRP